MGSSQSLPSFIFPEMSENDLKTFVNSLNSSNRNSLELKYEKTLGKGRVSWSMLVRNGNNLLLMRLYAKKHGSSNSIGLSRRRSASLSSMDPLSATKLSFIHELYYEKCAQFDFVLKPLLINDSEEFLVLVRPFARYNLPDRLITEALGFQDKLWIGLQLLESFLKLHALRAFHGDFGSGKVFLTSQNKVVLGDFAPIKPFCLQSRTQKPIEFYQIWFDEGLDGEISEIGRGCYLAPERLKFNALESFEAADLFSLGCVLAELFGSRGFLQFKDTLTLSNLEKDEEYDGFLSNCLEVVEEASFVVPLIKRLCARDPTRRHLIPSDLFLFQSRIDENLQEWRKSVISYRASDDYYEKRNLITKNMNNFSYFSLEGLLLLILREKDKLLRAFLLEHFLGNQQPNEDVLSILSESFDDKKDSFLINLLLNYLLKSEKIVCERFPLVNAINSGNRDALFQQISREPDLKVILRFLPAERMSKDRFMGILNKLLQIYRSKDVFDEDFESQMIFEYKNIEEEGLDNLMKTCWRTSNKLDSSNFAVFKRIAYQLDLEKNKISIEQVEKKRNHVRQAEDKVAHLNQPRLKQRILLKPTAWKRTGNILGICQSSDRTFFICYTENFIYFWDLKVLLKSAEPIASVNPRADAIITSVQFGYDDTNLIISFKDGIIGIYKVEYKNLSVDFRIKESFGPFEDENLKIFLCSTRTGKIISLIGRRKIYGIDPEDGEILFELANENFEIERVVGIVEGTCLLCVDSLGMLRLIEMFYETGQTLALWELKLRSEVVEDKEKVECESEPEADSASESVHEAESVHEIFSVEAITIDQTDACHLVVKVLIGSERAILVFKFDPLNVQCIFRHCILSSCDEMPKFQLVKTQNSSMKVNDEIVDVSDGIMRLIDFHQISSLNCTSILYPDSKSYKPTLKLRNKRGKVPEIIERAQETLIAQSESDLELTAFVGKILTVDDCCCYPVKSYLFMDAQIVKRGRGRPKKDAKEKENYLMEDFQWLLTENNEHQQVQLQVQVQQKAKKEKMIRKRGRPRKYSSKTAYYKENEEENWINYEVFDKVGESDADKFNNLTQIANSHSDSHKVKLPDTLESQISAQPSTQSTQIDPFRTSLPALCFLASSLREKSEILRSYLLAAYRNNCQDPEASHIPWSQVEISGIPNNDDDFTFNSLFSFGSIDQIFELLMKGEIKFNKRAY